jgi:hypothetical protein
MSDLLKELNSWVDACIEDFKSEDIDPSDYAHECADGSEWAIYYGKAWDLVCACRDHAPEMLDQADSTYSDIFSIDDANTDTRMCRLAYLIAHDALWGALSK